MKKCEILGAILIVLWLGLGFTITAKLFFGTPIEPIPEEEPPKLVTISETAGVGRIMPVEPEKITANDQKPAKMIVTATAYCPCVECCGKTDGITATGTIATQGRTIAADPSVLAYGTVLSINGNTYTVEDCGGAIKGNRIDIFYNSHEEALEFGIQELTAIIVE